MTDEKMTRDEIGKWLIDATLGDVLMVQGVAHMVFRSRLTAMRDRPEMARRDAEELSDEGLGDVRNVLNLGSFSQIPGGRELFDAVEVEALTRGTK